MFDAETISLIAAAPPLNGLDLSDLPRRLTDAYASIVAARIKMRDGVTAQRELSNDTLALIREMKLLASTHEAFTAVADDRENRISAAFVAGAAHHVTLMAERYMQLHPRSTILDPQEISPEVSATILFLIAEASADAAEMAKLFVIQGEDVVTASVLNAIRFLANGKLQAILEMPIPASESFLATTLANQGSRALYHLLFRGIRAIAERLLGYSRRALREPDPQILFLRVKNLSVEPIDRLSGGEENITYSVFPGPSHLAALLLSAAKDLSKVALVNVPAPTGIDERRWIQTMRNIAKHRPYLWRNHREAINAGYLETGVSAVMSFPTGAGKSTIAELKIATALLQGLKVVFLAPTLALVDQTARALSSTFPQAEVQRERSQIDIEAEILPAISVMTPERCLALISFDPDAFQDVGLLVFDECHIMHPKNSDRSRRAIDAMLCVLNFTAIANQADLLFLSAMMANSAEIAGWLEELTGRSCLSMVLPWKPTRQVRGCVVYNQTEIDALSEILRSKRREVTNKHVPAEIGRTLQATPFGFFCLHQTWQSQARKDYALLQLLEEQVLLATGTKQNREWYLTPNGNQVAATLAAATARKGFKTLVFTQTIPLANSACNAVSEIIGSSSVALNEDEKRLYAAAIDELGGVSHVYLEVEEDIVLAASACHHGLLLPAERHLHESLFKRPDGVRVLIATSTLAQGMNLPSEVVIIAGDKRFDPGVNRLQQLEAYELLNAAGRAGRAGEASHGFVLVVPSKVVYLNNEQNTIHRHWSDLKAIFQQSDQCLVIDDPMTGLLDQIHGATNISAIAHYFLKRLPVSETEGDAPARNFVGRSFAAFRARVQNNEAWLNTRLDSAMALRISDPDMLTALTWQDRLAAAAGVPVAVIRSLAEPLTALIQTDATVIEWRDWLRDWLIQQPQLLPQLIRREDLEGMFGMPYKLLNTDEERGMYVANSIFQLLELWMTGATLAQMEQTFSTPVTDVGKCEKAREFVLRIVPELAYIFGLPAQVYRLARKQQGISSEAPLGLGALGQCVREGFDIVDKLAIRQVRNRRIFRREIHREYTRIQRYLSPSESGENFNNVVSRVRIALELINLV